MDLRGSIINDLSINIAGWHYPQAEMALVSLRTFYPAIPINIALHHLHSYREPFLKKMGANVFYIEETEHGHKLDMLVEKCNTKYFLACDDDIFVMKHGGIEQMIELMKRDVGYAVIAELQSFYLFNDNDMLLSSRFDPAFAMVCTETFLKYKMTFVHRLGDEIHPDLSVPYRARTFFDTGSLLFIDVLKYNLPYFDFDYRPFVKHYGGVHKNFYEYLRVNLNEFEGRDYTIPRLEEDMFEMGAITANSHHILRDLIHDNHILVDQLEAQNSS